MNLSLSPRGWLRACASPMSGKRVTTGEVQSDSEKRFLLSCGSYQGPNLWLLLRLPALPPDLLPYSVLCWTHSCWEPQSVIPAGLIKDFGTGEFSKRSFGDPFGAISATVQCDKRTKRLHAVQGRAIGHLPCSQCSSGLLGTRMVYVVSNIAADSNSEPHTCPSPAQTSLTLAAELWPARILQVKR